MARMTPERFAAGLARDCTAAQLETVRAKMAGDGWKPFSYNGHAGRVVVFMSRATGVRSNVAPEKDHMRVHHDGSCVRYDPRRR